MEQSKPIAHQSERIYTLVVLGLILGIIIIGASSLMAGL